MKPVEATQPTQRGARTTKPANELHIAVTFRRPQDGIGPTKLAARISSASVSSLLPDALDMDKALYELNQRGFTTTGRGKMTASIRGPAALFEKVFGTKLAKFNLNKGQMVSA